MIRRAAIIGSAASLTLFFSLAAAFIISPAGQLAYHARNGRALWTEIQDDRILITTVDNAPGPGGFHRYALLTKVSPGYEVFLDRRGAAITSNSHLLGLTVATGNGTAYLLPASPRHFSGPIRHTGIHFPTVVPLPPPSVRFMVVSLSRWLLLLSTGVLGLPALWFLAQLVRCLARERRNFRHGHCLKCGYDLRASGSICPECGTPRPAASPAISSPEPRA